MKKNNFDAVIITSSDPHMSEYLPEHWNSRAWISGFTGSAGIFVITEHEAGLWTDSRYYIQAEQQLKDSTIELYKDGLEETPTIYQFLRKKIKVGGTIAINGETFSISQYKRLLHELIGYTINTSSDGIEKIWLNRPQLPTNQIKIYDIRFAGESAYNKIEKIRNKTTKDGGIFIVSALDEIAWTLNIRGEEIKNNPVVISYLIFDKHNTTLFIDSKKLNPQTIEYLLSINVSIKDYTEVFKFINHTSEKIIFVDPNTTNVKILDAIPTSSQVLEVNSPIPLLKSIRNSIEIKSVKNAMVKDGIALVKFLIWLEKNLDNNITEIDIAEKLYQYRSQQPLFVGESFDTIAGYKEHGAIVHYTANKDSNKTLMPKGLLLVDSGAQYLDGTTDITRTIALGELTNDEKLDYTLVLKGHINLAKAKFPKGTRGSQLDILARLPLWEAKKNFLHGTGHGVGHFLCVHEGPQSIRMQENSTQLELGMLTSNEPGIYIANSHGVRIENLILVQPFDKGLFGEYYQFETITLCPICTKGVIKEMLTQEEIDWLNNYHSMVFNTLSPHLDNEEKSWLELNTSKL